MKILYEDKHIVCVEKPVGVLSQSGAGDSALPDLVTLLTEREAALGNPEPYIGVVHRLDAGVGGAMVYAKKPYAAAALSEAIRGRDFTKEYLCVVSGRPQEDAGEYRDLLWKDAKANKVYVVDRTRNGVKEASLSYRVLQTVERDGEIYSLLRVTLGTGRSHQIRCQLSHHGTPILCDGKYGGHRPADVSMAGRRTPTCGCFDGRHCAVVVPSGVCTPCKHAGKHAEIRVKTGKAAVRTDAEAAGEEAGI